MSFCDINSIQCESSIQQVQFLPIKNHKKYKKLNKKKSLEKLFMLYL